VTAAAIGALLGTLAVLYATHLPPEPLAEILLWIGIGILLLRRHSRIGVAVACAMLAFAWTAFQASDYLERRWGAAFDGERVLADLIVETIPVGHGDAWSFDASAHGTMFRVISRDRSVRPRAGERWQLVLALRAPKSRINPGAVDLEQQYFRARIHATATVVKSRLNRRIDAGHRPLARLREAAARRIEARVDDRDAAALIQALAVGATGSMSAQQWQVFNATGTSHLVAISGLHVTMFATAAFFVSRRLWSRVLWRFTAWPRDNVAALLALGASLAYSLLAGLSVPTQRTLIMLAAWLLARSLARVSTPFGPLWLALFAVLAFDSFAPLAAGFWLSFAAMAAIIAATEFRVVRRGSFRKMLAAQGAVTVMLAPLSVAWFGSISAVGLLVNLVAIPLVSWVFVPTILVAVILMPLWPAASDVVLDLAARLHEAGWSWLVAASELPAAMLRLQPPLWWYPLAVIGSAAASLPLPLRMRFAAVLWLIPLAFAQDAEVPAGGFEVLVLDAGQGTAVLVRTAQRTLLYGTGEVYGTDGRVMENAVLPVLRHEGVERVDALIVPTLSSTVSVGVTALLAEMPVVSTFIGDGCAMSWRWDEVRFDLRPGCELDVESAAGQAHLHGRFVIAVPWIVVSGRRPIAGREPPSLRRWLVPTARLLDTDGSGAIRLPFDPASGPGEPQQMRALQPRLWRLTP
jgi:competence protein ComEC